VTPCRPFGATCQAALHRGCRPDRSLTPKDRWSAEIALRGDALRSSRLELLGSGIGSVPVRDLLAGARELLAALPRRSAWPGGSVGLLAAAMCGAEGDVLKRDGAVHQLQMAVRLGHVLFHQSGGLVAVAFLERDEDIGVVACILA